MTGPRESWLALLLADASVDALVDLRERLVGETEEADRPRVEAEASAAQRIHAQLAQGRRHARELAALNDLARRLASLHDVEALLQEVVVQSRQLLGVDVAYIMVRRAGAELRIEAVDGSIGSALRGIVLHEGEGLGGEVLRTGRPMWSEDYLHDPRLDRGDFLDQAASNEQLGGMLAVPLQVGDETLGVLLVADRHPRTYADRETELLAALAAHATVALSNARLIGRYKQALTELRSDNHDLRELDTRRQRAAELRERLLDVSIRGGGPAEVAAAVGQALGTPVLVRDAHGEPLNPGPAVVEVEAVPVPMSRRSWSAEHPQTVRLPHNAAQAAVTAILLRDGYAGCLITLARDRVDDEAVQLLEIGATSLALVIASERTVAEAELRTRGEFISALLAPDVDHASIRRRALVAGVDLDAVRTVLVLDPDSAEVQPAAALAQRLAAEHGGWSAEHGGAIVVLVPAAEPDDVRRRIVALADGRLPAAVGVAACAGGTEAVRGAHDAARQTAILLLALGRDRAVARPADLGVYRSLFSTAGRREIAEFVDATLGEVLRHDAERHRDLTATLDAYLRHARHHARTCEALHVHANTLYNRLDRLTELLGDDWRDPDRVLELQLALRMRELMVALTPAGER
jgi:GAF domain-containing protein